MAKALIQHGETEVERSRIAFTLLRMPRRRHTHLVIADDGSLQVRAPRRFSVKRAKAVVREHGDWVLAALEAADRRIRERPVLRSGTRLPMLDAHLRLAVTNGTQLDLFAAGAPAERPHPDDTLLHPAGRATLRGASLEIVSVSPSQEGLRDLLEAWYRREAARRLPPRLRQLARRLDVVPGKVVIRAQRSRWGSCSEHGTVSLNWRLLLLPGRLVDYVLAHELCHLRHMNHSAGFWRMVAGVVPDYRERRERLNALQSTLPL